MSPVTSLKPLQERLLVRASQGLVGESVLTLSTSTTVLQIQSHVLCRSLRNLLR